MLIFEEIRGGIDKYRFPMIRSYLSSCGKRESPHNFFSLNKFNDYKGYSSSSKEMRFPIDINLLHTLWFRFDGRGQL